VCVLFVSHPSLLTSEPVLYLQEGNICSSGSNPLSKAQRKNQRRKAKKEEEGTTVDSEDLKEDTLGGTQGDEARGKGIRKLEKKLRQIQALDDKVGVDE